MSKTGKMVDDGGLNDFYKPRAYVHPPMVCVGPTMTRQEFAEDCDINTIMARYEKTGELPVNGREPMYLDLSAVPRDFASAMQHLIDAESAFMSLPAVVRKEFDNDPLKFVQYAQDPESLDQMRDWGLAKPVEAAPPPLKVEMVNPPPAPVEPAVGAKKA